MTANLNFSELPSINAFDLDAVVGGEGWGEWAGKYIGAGLGGAAGAGLGFVGGGAVAGPPGAAVGSAALGSVGGAMGYDYGAKAGKWLTGGR